VNVQILPSAKRDLLKGFRFYEGQATGAGDYFLDSLYSDIDSIFLFAGIHRKRGELFRFKSKRFPFWIYYRLENDTAFVVAVLDARQTPSVIQRREDIEQGNVSNKND
jgi:plasmid stabilization system protein ParE